MKFVECHLTSHHFFHAPHRWFFAVLFSPIHFAELHYKKYYHLTYEHAKKLFIFDLSLLAAIGVLWLATIFWFAYDPTVTAQVTLLLRGETRDDHAPPTKIRAGSFVTYTASYKNESRATLADGTLALTLPNNFALERAEPSVSFSSSTHAFHLPALPPGAHGSVSIGGFFNGSPNQEFHITALLSYRQTHRDDPEQKISTNITTLRESVLAGTITAPKEIIGNGTFQATVTLENTGLQTLSGVTLPFGYHPAFRVTNVDAKTGSSTLETWRLPPLLPSDSASAIVTFVSDIPNQTDTAALTLTPTIIKEGALPQQQMKHSFSVRHPHVTVDALWKDTVTFLRPGDVALLAVTLRNDGEENLHGLVIRIQPKTPITAFGKELVISEKQESTLATLIRRDTKTILVPIPVAPHIISEGKELALGLAPAISAHVVGVPEGTYNNGTKTLPVPIASRLSVSAAARYYTDEGDQLGRGPLPPTVGKETKYWISVRLGNGTNDVDNLSVRGTLPVNIMWTGKHSMSIGTALSYDPLTRALTWDIRTLPANIAGFLDFEVSFTPKEEDRGTTPLLLEGVTANGHDAYVDTALSGTTGAVDASLQNDEMGRRRGTRVL